MNKRPLSKQQREWAWALVVDTAEDSNPSPRDRSNAQLLALMLIADSLDEIAGSV